MKFFYSIFWKLLKAVYLFHVFSTLRKSSCFTHLHEYALGKIIYNIVLSLFYPTPAFILYANQVLPKYKSYFQDSKIYNDSPFYEYPEMLPNFFLFYKGEDSLIWSNHQLTNVYATEKTKMFARWFDLYIVAYFNWYNGWGLQLLPFVGKYLYDRFCWMCLSQENLTRVYCGFLFIVFILTSIFMFW